MFVPLPPARPEVEEEAKKCIGYFTGEHEKVLKPAAAPAPASGPGPKPTMKDFTELERLAYVVSRVERDTHVLPRGAFKFTPIQEYRKNDQFKGRLSTHL